MIMNIIWELCLMESSIDTPDPTLLYRSTSFSFFFGGIKGRTQSVSQQTIINHQMQVSEIHFANDKFCPENIYILKCLYYNKNKLSKKKINEIKFIASFCGWFCVCFFYYK